MNYIEEKLFKNEFSFAAYVMRYAFGIYFVLVAVKKFRDGLTGFADSITAGGMKMETVAAEIPWIFIYSYGIVLPFIELAGGLLLLVNQKTRWGYSLIALAYLTFIFGQMYSGNTGKIGTDYMPSLVALCVAVYAYEKSKSV